MLKPDDEDGFLRTLRVLLSTNSLGSSIERIKLARTLLEDVLDSLDRMIAHRKGDH